VPGKARSNEVPRRWGKELNNEQKYLLKPRSRHFQTPKPSWLGSEIPIAAPVWGKRWRRSGWWARGWWARGCLPPSKPRSALLLGI